MLKQVFLKYGKDESLRRFHPWIFSGAIHHFSDEIEDGEVVEVYASTPRPDHSGFDHEFIAVGHYQVGSIMVRVLSFEQEPIDQQFYEKRIRAAYEMRRTLRLEGTSYRLVHGEGDSLPGLVVDVYNRTAVMQAHSVGMHRQRTVIADALKQVLGDAIDNIYYKSETTLAYAAEADGGNGFLLGGSADDVAEENGLRFHVDWLRGQKTGFFVDQRDNRALLERYSRDRRVLNMFCYTGGFSFYALRGGATLVHSVDSSQKAIDLTRANVELNFPADTRHEAFAEDAFRFLDNMQERMERLDDEQLGWNFENPNDSERRKAVGKVYAKGKGVQDSAGKKPASNWKPETRRSQLKYQRLRDYNDLAEDVLLDVAIDQAKNRGDGETEKALRDAKKELTEIKRGKHTKTIDINGLGDGSADDDKAIMEELRARRKEILREHGVI